MKNLHQTFIILITATLLAACESDNFSGSENSYAMSDGSSGTGGSMARFTIKDNNLYAVTSTELKTFDISNPSDIQSNGTVDLDWGVETIFPYGDYLFIGTMTGMHIMDVSTPALPKLVGTYTHVVSCDPVVVRDQYAYVTLHSENNWCGRNTNQLQVIDIAKVLADPYMDVDAEKVFNLTKPLGLGVTDKYLFVCDEELKVYDRTDPVNLVYLTSFTEVQTPYDVIPHNNLLLVIAENGFYQYQYSNQQITYLSHIPVKN